MCEPICWDQEKEWKGFGTAKLLDFTYLGSWISTETFIPKSKCRFEDISSWIKACHRNKSDLMLAGEEMSQKESAEKKGNLFLGTMNLCTKYDGILATTFRVVCWPGTKYRMARQSNQQTPSGKMEHETDRWIHEACAVMWAGCGTIMLKRELSLKAKLSIYQWIQPCLLEIMFIHSSFAKANTFRWKHNADWITFPINIMSRCC